MIFAPGEKLRLHQEGNGFVAWEAEGEDVEKGRVSTVVACESGDGGLGVDGEGSLVAVDDTTRYTRLMG